MFFSIMIKRNYCLIEFKFFVCENEKIWNRNLFVFGLGIILNKLIICILLNYLVLIIYENFVLLINMFMNKK